MPATKPTLGSAIPRLRGEFESRLAELRKALEEVPVIEAALRALQGASHTSGTPAGREGRGSPPTGSASLSTARAKRGAPGKPQRSSRATTARAGGGQTAVAKPATSKNGGPVGASKRVSAPVDPEARRNQVKAEVRRNGKTVRLRDDLTRARTMGARSLDLDDARLEAFQRSIEKRRV
jgi:hypothetical protein